MDGVVTSKISKEDFYSQKSEEFVEEAFGGSLPAFLAAFTSHQKLSKKDIAEIRNIIDKIK
ncbi:MAG: BlaI/MecI/CopY family transcriptional regulator [Butyrivibrio sp.]|nr:BlaI/MecI/CopY family transcriptional regulator [Butyrivibrio sp.]